MFHISNCNTVIINISSGEVNKASHDSGYKAAHKRDKPLPEILRALTMHKLHALRISEDLAGLYDSDNPVKAVRIRDCGTFLAMRKYSDIASTCELSSANFCKHPLCPMCAWRWSLKYGQIVEYALSFCTYPLSFLTLTIPNTPELSSASIYQLRRQAIDFTRLYFKQNYLGYIMAIEITASIEQGFHPHIHAIIETSERQSYTLEAISRLQREWGRMWGYDWLKATLYPIDDRAKAAREMSKYLVKASAPPTKEQLHIIAAATHGLRRLAFQGTLYSHRRAAKKALTGQNKAREDELSKYEWEMLFYKWLAGSYTQSRE